LAGEFRAEATRCARDQNPWIICGRHLFTPGAGQNA